MSEKNEIIQENPQIAQLRKNYFTRLINSQKENKISPRYKSNKLFSEINKNNINIKKEKFKIIDIKSHNKSISINQEDLTIYEEIKNEIENFIEKNNTNNELIISTLTQILSFINSLFSSLLKTNKSKISKNNLENSKNDILDLRYKIIYEARIEQQNKRIKQLKQEIELLNMNNINDESKKSSRQFIVYNSLKKKIFELENKLKINEYKYLLCIKEQQTKIIKLEEELKMKKIETDSDDIKKASCFPNLIQYNYKEDINPKSIPLNKSILKKYILKKKIQGIIINPKFFKKIHF